MLLASPLGTSYGLASPSIFTTRNSTVLSAEVNTNPSLFPKASPTNCNCRSLPETSFSLPHSPATPTRNSSMPRSIGLSAAAISLRDSTAGTAATLSATTNGPPCSATAGEASANEPSSLTPLRSARAVCCNSALHPSCSRTNRARAAVANCGNRRRAFRVSRSRFYRSRRCHHPALPQTHRRFLPANLQRRLHGKRLADFGWKEQQTDVPGRFHLRISIAVQHAQRLTATR